MNKKFKDVRKPLKHSPQLFDDEEIGTSSPDEVKHVKSLTPRNNSFKGHSTPIRNKIKTDSSDSPEFNYESPIELLTQHPPSDVGWDYHRPITKEEDGQSFSSMDISKTPKRNAALLSKKRNSNSPLLYKPLKKKLIQEEQQENLAWFMEELKAIEMKAKKIGEKNTEVQKNNSNEESQLVVELDSDPSGDSDLKLQVSVNTDESPGQHKVVAVNKNDDGLLDDSIEDMLVLCSQQVEAQEFGLPKGQSITEFTTKPLLANSSNEKISADSSKQNLQSGNNNKIVGNLSSKNSSLSKGESGSLEIPDDSFDDFVVDFDDKDFCQNAKTEKIIDNANKSVKSYNVPCTKSVSSTSMTNSKNSSNQNKFFQSKNSIHTKETKVIAQNKVINTKATYGYLNQDYTKNSNSSGFVSQTQESNNSDKNNETRLFKSKSYSDSNFFQQSSSIINFEKSYDNFSNIETLNQSKKECNFVQKNVSNTTTEVKGWRRVQSSSSLGESSSRNNSHVNRISNSEESLQLSTPAEIERKRQEAIMKREARLKMRTNNSTVNRLIQKSVKR